MVQRGVYLYEPKALKAWGIVVLCDQRRMQPLRDGEGATVNNFLMEFKEVLESVGMSVGPVRRLSSHPSPPLPPSLPQEPAPPKTLVGVHAITTRAAL